MYQYVNTSKDLITFYLLSGAMSLSQLSIEAMITLTAIICSAICYIFGTISGACINRCHRVRRKAMASQDSSSNPQDLIRDTNRQADSEITVELMENSAYAYGRYCVK